MLVVLLVGNKKNDMTNLKIVTLESRGSSKNLLPIYIAVCHKRQSRYINTNYSVDDLYQFDNGLVVCRKDAKIMNQRLKYTLSEYQEKLDSIENINIYTCSQIKDILTEEIQHDELITISELITDKINNLKKTNRIGYAHMMEWTLKSVLSSIGDITINSISCSTIKLYQNSLNKYSAATQQMRLAQFKSVINEAIKDGLVKYDTHPFSKLEMPHPDIRLLDITIDEFIRIRDLETKHIKISLAKDLFLLSFYLGGINLIDLLGSKYDKGILTYVRTKTQNKKKCDKTISISIPEPAQQILKKYITRSGYLDMGYKFSYHNFQCYLNNCIHMLADKLGIDRLCYYSARKTFAQFAFDLGIKTEVIEYCIGQSMKSNRPIYNYVRVMQRQADGAIAKVIDYTINPEKYADIIYSEINKE